MSIKIGDLFMVKNIPADVLVIPKEAMIHIGDTVKVTAMNSNEPDDGFIEVYHQHDLDIRTYITYLKAEDLEQIN